MSIHLVFSFLLCFTGALFIALSNIGSLYFEYVLLARVHKDIIAVDSEQQEREEDNHNEEEDTVEETDTEELTRNYCKKAASVLLAPFRDLKEGWAVYSKQKIMPAGIALALLFVSVLQFGSIMTVVLNWAGVPPYVIAIFRGLGALFGILATTTFGLYVQRVLLHSRCLTRNSSHARVFL